MRADNKVYSSSKQNSNCNAAHVTRLTPPNVCGQDLMQTQFSIAKRYKGSQKKMRDDCDYKENEITPKWNDTATILEGSISVLPSPCLSRACAQKGLSGHDSLSRIQPTQQCCFAPSSLTFEFLWTAKQRTSLGSFIINETSVGVQVLRGSTMGHNGALRVILRWLLSQALSRSVILERAYKKVENVWGSILAMASHSGKHADLGILTPLTVI